MNKARFEENYNLISRHLVKFADDGDSDSLMCRFGELMIEFEELHFKIKSAESYGNIMYQLLVKEHNNREKSSSTIDVPNQVEKK